MRKSSAVVLGSAAAACLLAATLVSAQQGFTRKIVQQSDTSVPGRDVVTVVADVEANGSSGRHTHPGDEVSYVAQGPVVLEVDGQPARTLQTGEAFIVKQGIVHNAKGNGSVAGKIIANFFVEKGKPVTTPAP